MPTLSLAARIQQPRPILADGAIATLVQTRANIAPTDCFDALNLTHPELIQQAHVDYVLAGADLLETNTFGANRHKLGERGLADQLAEINSAGVRLARAAIDQAGREDVYVVGAIGPIGVRLKPYGWMRTDEAREIFAEQIAALASAGVDGILFETFSDHEELVLAVTVARETTPDLPVIAQATFSADGLTYTGRNAARVAHDLQRAGATVIGVNCGNGPARTAQILQAMHGAIPAMPLSAMPNAGFPEFVGGRVMFPAQADYFGEYAITFRALSARIIGGCCGTTPEHIAAMRQRLDQPPTASTIEVHVIEPTSDEKPEASIEHATILSQRLREGKFTVTVEVTPPRSYNAEKMLTHTRLLRDAGADLVNVADTPAAKMKMSAWAAAYLIQDRIGIETVLHFPTRGRNLLRVQGDLLAAHALGLRNLFVVMGDPTKVGDYPQAMDTYDIVPSALIDLISHRMNRGTDMAGNSIGSPTVYNVGCALNMAADDLDQEIKVLRKKLAAGANFALGQAIYDPARITAFHKRYEELEGHPLELPVLVAVIPLNSLKHAQFMHNEVPGHIIPDVVFKRLEDAGDRAPQEGVKIAQEIIAAIRGQVQGAYIIPSSGRYDLAAEVIAATVSAPSQA